MDQRTGVDLAPCKFDLLSNALQKWNPFVRGNWTSGGQGEVEAWWGWGWLGAQTNLGCHGAWESVIQLWNECAAWLRVAGYETYLRLVGRTFPVCAGCHKSHRMYVLPVGDLRQDIAKRMRTLWSPLSCVIIWWAFECGRLSSPTRTWIKALIASLPPPTTHITFQFQPGVCQGQWDTWHTRDLGFLLLFLLHLVRLTNETKWHKSIKAQRGAFAYKFPINLLPCHMNMSLAYPARSAPPPPACLLRLCLPGVSEIYLNQFRQRKPTRTWWTHLKCQYASASVSASASAWPPPCWLWTHPQCEQCADASDSLTLRMRQRRCPVCRCQCRWTGRRTGREEVETARKLEVAQVAETMNPVKSK